MSPACVRTAFGVGRRGCVFLLSGGLLAAPANASTESICTALKADPVDVAAVRRVVRTQPEAMGEICEIEWTSPQMGAVELLVGLVVFPYLVYRANRAGRTFIDQHGTLELAVMRASPEATRVLLAAGADPVAHGRRTASALERGVALDLEAGTMDWSELLIADWSGTMPSDTLTTQTLDRLFFAPALEARLRSAGLPAHGEDHAGTTWLHRSVDDRPRFRDEAPLTFDAVMARGIPIWQKDDLGRTALYAAAAAENWAAYDALLDAGARPERAGSEPQTILRPLAEGGSLTRYEQTLGQLVESGHVVAGDLTSLAERLLFRGDVAYCRSLAELGATPSAWWWESQITLGWEDKLLGALDAGFVVPGAAVPHAMRREQWRLAQTLLSHADLSSAALRRLQRQAFWQGAPPEMKQALKRARAPDRSN